MGNDDFQCSHCMSENTTYIKDGNRIIITCIDCGKTTTYTIR